MGNESLLKKEFKENDLKRIRNLVKKDFNSKTKVQVGYQIEINEHKEGDVWFQGGKNWTIKNGIKTTVTKLDKVRKVIQIPFSCPECGKSLKNKIDSKFYMFHKKCFDCVVEFETQLRIHGKWEEYLKEGIKQNFEWFIKDLRAGLDNFINTVDSDSYISESGDIENWVGNKINKEKITKDVEDYISELQSKLNI